MNYYPLIKLRVNLAVLQSRKNRAKLRQLQKELLQQRLRLVKLKQEKPIVDFRQEMIVAKNQALGEFERTSRKFKDRQNLSNTLSKLRNDFHTYLKEYRRSIRFQIQNLNHEISLLKKDTYLQQINQAKLGINHRHQKQLHH
jgi:hypothetical protein